MVAVGAGGFINTLSSTLSKIVIPLTAVLDARLDDNDDAAAGILPKENCDFVGTV